MADVSVKTILVTSLLVCLLAAKGLCRPDSNEDSYKYHDDEGDDDGEFGDDYKDDTDIGQPPVMKSQPLILEVHSGDTVVLPCATVNMSNDVNSFAVTWEKDSRILYMDTVQYAPKDPRITFSSPDSTLFIRNVSASDSGHYYCTYRSHPPVHVMHIVNVFAPAAIRGVQPRERRVSVEKGSTVALKCNVTGYPPPIIAWKKLGKHDQSDAAVIAASENITLYSVGRQNSGIYECTAKNDLGPEVSAQVSIRVTYAPEIVVDEELVTSGKDYETKLKCVVHADPKANVTWLKDNVVVSASDHVRIYVEGNRHYYHIDKTQDSDFGKYQCKASNSKGTTQSKKIELTGKPLTPQKLKASIGANGRSLNVTREIVSYCPMLEYRVLYRNVKDSQWQTFQPPVEDAAEGNVYKLEYQIKDLPDGDYLETVQARNCYGWSNQAEPHSFTIKNESNEATAETSKLEEGSIHSDSARPRITAVLIIFSLCAFFL